MLIDLDAMPAPARPRPWPVRRLLKPAALAALLLLVIGGAASPAQARVIDKVADTGGTSVSTQLLTPAALYTAHLRGGVDRSVVEAVPLVPGGPRWQVAITADQPGLSMNDDGTTLMVRPGQQGPITFLDARTGKVRWRIGDFAAAHLLGDRVVYWEPAISDGPAAALERVRMADVTTGRTIWERSGQPMALDVDRQRRTVLAVDQDGIAAVYAAADGHVLASGRDLGVDPFEWMVLEDQGISTTEIIGDNVYVHSETFVAAFRLRDLKPLWRTPVADPQVLGGCGALACVIGPRGLTVLDPATGRIRWSSPRWRSITSEGLAVAGDFTAVRLDPATGQVVTVLGRGEVIGDLLMRYDRDRTWVTRLADGEIIGVLPLIGPAACERAGPYLACATAGQTVTVWNVRR
ncbi:outer membrane protein assembly factor BamB family protein [Paractinoplanes toevensis]|uniref:outer membrane protein assembly factor BamB family protein n=1 Tax=Paractinoplanes toevensis TaxID=571911 RepID=UPI001BB32B1D|nr:PQQ-binding-like beta-propeller repeat protein [Actinoplanes toevensis]